GKAAARLKEAIDRGPRFAGARIRLLELFQEKEWEPDGTEAARALEAAAPRSPLPALHRSQRYRELGDVPAALRELRASLTLDRGRAKAFDELQELLVLAGDPEAAERALRDRMALDPGRRDALEEAARFEEGRGEWDKAVAALREVEALAAP